MTKSDTQAQATDSAPPHPHGWFGYMISDKKHTQNAQRLIRTAAVSSSAMLTLAAITAYAILKDLT